MKLLLLFAAIAQVFACQVIEGDKIFGKDLAAANPMFAALDPNLEVCAAPLPGVQRILRADELVRLARQHRIELTIPVAAICMERATEPLTAEKLLIAMRQSLGVEDAQIEIIDFSHFGVPRGTLEFPHSGLMPNGLWRGRLLYDQGRSMPVWVKTRITVERTWVEASQPLAAGKTIDLAQLTVKKGPRFPFEPVSLSTADLVAGRRPVRTIPAGTVIAANMLMIAHDIERGDLVAVEVKVGAAILDFEATAESSGRTGDSILIKNPDNGRSFLAKIQDKGHVLVQK